MKMRLVVLLLGACIATGSLAAKLPDSAIAPGQKALVKLLKGNTLNGEWAGRPFRQHFSESGSTKYKDGNGSVSLGIWRVNASGQYCSVWPPSSREVCYDVLVDGMDVYWKSGGEIYFSTVSIGDRF